VDGCFFVFPTEWAQHVIESGAAALASGPQQKPEESINSDKYFCQHQGRNSQIFTKFLLKNPAIFLLALIFGILSFPCAVT
jgi:hypothetical protein